MLRLRMLTAVYVTRLACTRLDVRTLSSCDSTVAERELLILDTKHENHVGSPGESLLKGERHCTVFRRSTQSQSVCDFTEKTASCCSSRFVCCPVKDHPADEELHQGVRPGLVSLLIGSHFPVRVCGCTPLLGSNWSSCCRFSSSTASELRLGHLTRRHHSCTQGDLHLQWADPEYRDDL